ncbi:hypothetical protein [Methylobacterium sp. J-092]|uniref:hypothetical protein n=1 Tax=Methylobacterium sp. J-092 TaxID=2836667 RepID=UPI001FBA6A90|nr:hypothetical protein [Methylobacterium sp. J-092]MCJ2009173.1 hypothetical protein [Methylobacterium sp. J-092]
MPDQQFENHKGLGSPRPGDMFVIPPRSIMADELRMARLEQYLEAEFPALEFVMAADPKMARDQPAAGVRAREDGDEPLSKPELEELIERVLDAVAVFADYGQRLH